jgi:hypothetical protein
VVSTNITHHVLLILLIYYFVQSILDGISWTVSIDFSEFCVCSTLFDDYFSKSSLRVKISVKSSDVHNIFNNKELIEYIHLDASYCISFEREEVTRNGAVNDYNIYSTITGSENLNRSVNYQLTFY